MVHIICVLHEPITVQSRLTYRDNSRESLWSSPWYRMCGDVLTDPGEIEEEDERPEQGGV